MKTPINEEIGLSWDDIQYKEIHKAVQDYFGEFVLNEGGVRFFGQYYDGKAYQYTYDALDNQQISLLFDPESVNKNIVGFYSKLCPLFSFIDHEYTIDKIKKDIEYGQKYTDANLSCSVQMFDLYQFFEFIGIDRFKGEIIDFKSTYDVKITDLDSNHFDEVVSAYARGTYRGNGKEFVYAKTQTGIDLMLTHEQFEFKLT